MAEAISTEKIQLNWTKPKSNGSIILNIRVFVYKIDKSINNDKKLINNELINELVLEGDETNILIENLEIETDYECVFRLNLKKNLKIRQFAYLALPNLRKP